MQSGLHIFYEVSRYALWSNSRCIGCGSCVREMRALAKWNGCIYLRVVVKARAVQMTSEAVHAQCRRPVAIAQGGPKVKLLKPRTLCRLMFLTLPLVSLVFLAACGGGTSGEAANKESVELLEEIRQEITALTDLRDGIMADILTLEDTQAEIAALNAEIDALETRARPYQDDEFSRWLTRAEGINHLITDISNWLASAETEEAEPPPELVEDVTTAIKALEDPSLDALLNEIVIEKGITEPAQILNELKTRIIKALSQTGEIGEHKDGMDISLCVWHKDTNKLEFAGAFNPLYLVRKGELIETKADRQSVGYVEIKGKPFTNHQIQLQKGDTLYTFSDGYADQYGGEDNSPYGKGKKFSKKRFKELVLSLQQQSMTKQKETFDTTIENYKGDLEQLDDILVIGVRI